MLRSVALGPEAALFRIGFFVELAVLSLATSGSCALNPKALQLSLARSLRRCFDLEGVTGSKGGSVCHA